MKIEQVFFEHLGKKIGGYFYLPEGKGPFPTVILIHGFGGGTHEQKNKSMCKALVENGFTAFMFDFYNKPNGLSEFPVEETSVSLQVEILRAAIDFVAKQSFVDPARIGLAGHSLGGMTVLLYASTDNRIKALVVQSGVSDFHTINSYNNPRWKQNGYMLFEKSWGEMKVNYSFIEDGMKYDVYSKAKEIKCPVLVIHGDKDESVPLEQSQKLMKFLKKKEELVIIKGAPHSYKDKVLEEVTSLLVGFMKKKLIGSR